MTARIANTGGDCGSIEGADQSALIGWVVEGQMSHESLVSHINDSTFFEQESIF